MTILGLQLTTHRLEQMRYFYAQTLQLPVQDEYEDMFSVQAGYTKLIFSLAEPDTQPTYAFGFSVPSAVYDNVTYALSQVIQLYAPEQRNTDPNTRPTVYFSDPAGNAVSLVSHDALPETVADANPLSLHAVGELTFVVDDVQDVRQALESRFEFTAYPTTSGTRVVMRGVDTTFYVIPRGETLLPEGGATAESFPIMMTLAGTVNAVDRIGEYPYFVHVSDVTSATGGITGARVEVRPT
jgi:hypothetical protein